MLVLYPITTKQEYWLRKSWWNALLVLEYSSWSIKEQFQQIHGFRDLRILSKDTNLIRLSPELELKGQTEIAIPTVRNFLQLEFKIDTLVALNDRSAIGALAAIKEKGISYPIAIFMELIFTGYEIIAFNRWCCGEQLLSLLCRWEIAWWKSSRILLMGRATLKR